MKELKKNLTEIICSVVFLALGCIILPCAAFADDNDDHELIHSQNIVHDSPPENSQTAYYYDGKYYHYEESYSAHDKAIASLTTGGVLIAGGIGMGIAAIAMDEDEYTGNKKRIILGITGAVSLGVGIFCTGFGAYLMHEWKTKNHTMSLAPTFNGAVFNMTF